LTGGAVAQLAVEGNVPAELVLDLSAVATGLVLDVELAVVLVDAVRRALLPLVLALGGVAAVLLMLGGVVLAGLLLSLLLWVHDVTYFCVERLGCDGEAVGEDASRSGLCDSWSVACDKVRSCRDLSQEECHVMGWSDARRTDGHARTHATI